MINWLFRSRTRLVMSALAALVATLFVMVGVVIVRLDGMAERMAAQGQQGQQGGPNTSSPVLTPGNPIDPYVEFPVQPSEPAGPAGPAGMTGDEALALGDPTPVAIVAVNDWLTADTDGLERHVLPAAIEELTAAPVPTGLRVNGPAIRVASGPTDALVRLPATLGPLLVTLVPVEGRWMVSGVSLGSDVLPKQ